MSIVHKAFDPPFYYPVYIIRSRLLHLIKTHATLLSGKMMDFGCGEKPYQSLFTNVSEYIGVDYEGQGHSHDKEDIDVYYDGKTIPFDDNTFDSVLATEVLEHIFNVDEILVELNRVMKPTAKILITTPFAWNEHEVPNDFGRYTSFAMRDLLERNGFKVLSIQKSSSFLETQTQLRSMYFHNYIAPRLKPIATISSYLFSMLNNAAGLLLSKLLPGANDSWYLNLVVLAEKTSSKR